MSEKSVITASAPRLEATPRKKGKKQESERLVGTSQRKVDALGMACGQALYVMDELPKNPLVGLILTSPHAHARIKSIDTSAAEKIKGVEAIIHHGNVPRIAYTTAGQGYPEPSPYDTFLFDNKVRYVGDRVAAIAAVDRATAVKAARAIKVEYEILKPIFDVEESLKPGAPIIHDEDDCDSFLPWEPKKNISGMSHAAVGDVEKGLAAADFVVQGKFNSHYTSHCALEPHVCATWLDANGRLVMRTSTQVPFHVRRLSALVLEIPAGRIHVIKPRVGGAFGGKQEVLNEPVCGMLTLRTHKPVVMEYTRAEDLISSRTRHPMRSWVRMGVKKNGDITAIDFDAIMNAGAYGTQTLTVLTNVGSKCLPLLRAGHLKWRGRCAYTNLPVGGAYRGYGATQGMFPLGVLIDMAAEAIGMDTVEFCLRNHIRTGDSSPIFEALGEGRAGVSMTIQSCGLEEAIKRGAKEIGWKEKRGKGRRTAGPKKRGVGMTILMQGSSIPEIDMAAAAMKLNDDGSVNLHVGATDLGTGSDTVLTQIAAETLKVPLRDVIAFSSDTDLTPFDVGAYASSTTYLSGMAVKKAAEELLAQMRAVAAEDLGVSPDELEHLDREFRVKGKPNKRMTFNDIGLRTLYMRKQHQVMAHASAISHASPPPFAAHFAEVEVDEETGHVRTLEYVAAVDCGTAINPKLAEGQTEGAIINALSSAVTEEYLFNNDGRMLNPTFNYYKIYSTPDVPRVKTILIETHEPTGPYGAKSVSEISTNGPLPAIANAIYDAVGVRLHDAPFTPERVLNAIKAKEKK
ncbi:molybdopterin-dependent oxidoreductase [Candidatus Poribacteria bacterium]|nr:molybdopterin-dependent oxidoreductase [Candidatus Poribacteria bacterium]